MTAEAKTIRIPANLPAVATACDFVARVAAAAGMTDKQVHQCQLAVDEACTNIIEHGYRADNHQQFIDVACVIFADRIVIRIEDDSPAYNPLQRDDPEPDADAPLEDRERGGWGVFFIKQLMDEVVYHYQHGRNHLEMTRYFQPRPAAQAAKLDLTIKNHSRDIVLIGLQGQLNDDTHSKLERSLAEHLQTGHKYLVLDMYEVQAISSTGWQVLIGTAQRARSLRGDLILANLDGSAREVIKLTGLDMVFTVADSVEDAVKHLSSSK